MRRNSACLLILLLIATVAPGAGAQKPAVATKSAKPPAAKTTTRPPAKTTPAKPAAPAATPPTTLTPAQALADETADVPAAALQGTPEQLSRWATDHLIAGLWFDRAIAQLQAALKQDPNNSQYHLALGCAEADRAASLSYATSWRGAMDMMQSIYPMEEQMWEQGQKDPKNFEYGQPKPQPPPKYKVWTKDDYRELTLTQAQVSARVDGLAKAAKAEWAQALALCQTPDQKALAEYTQGWGLRLLDKAQTETSTPGLAGGMADMFGGQKDDDAIKALTAATQDSPDTALYWQSLGDALYQNPALANLMGMFTQTAAPPAPKTGEMTALDAYQQSLKIQSGNPMLWYRVALLVADKDPGQALADLKLAASGDPDNAYLAYQAAALEFKKSKFTGAFDLMAMMQQAAQQAAKSGAKQPNGGADTTSNDTFEVTVTPGAGASGSTDSDTISGTTGGAGSFTPNMPSPEQTAKKAADAYNDEASRDLAVQAVTLMEQGNDAPLYRTPVYTPAVPKLMAVAWGYGNQIDLDPTGGIDSMQLAEAACEYAQAAGSQGDTDDAATAARAVIAMGYKMMNGITTGNGITGLGTGAGAVGMGYSALEQVYKDAGDDDMVQQVQAEEKAFETQMQSSMTQEVQGWMQSFLGNY